MCVNIPVRYPRPDTKSLEEMLDGAAEDSEDYAVESVAHAKLAVMRGAANANDTKAWVLIGAMISKVVAIAAIAGAVWAVL